MNISIIGAGLGGLSAAALLAAKGHKVQVFEKNEQAGGKMGQIHAEGFRFDTGPSLLTMPFVFERLFNECGADFYDYLELAPLHPLCRYFYSDGTIFNSYFDRSKTQKELSQIAPSDVKAYDEFLNYSADLYKKTADAFIFNPLYALEDLRKLDFLSFFGIDAFNTVSERIDNTFSSPYLRQFFKRFTTYNGSSPFQAPATLNVIPHVEINQGGFYVKGGLYQVAQALQRLAEKNGAVFHFNEEIDGILVEDGKAKGVKLTSGSTVPAQLVISNSDATETVTELLPDDAISSRKKRNSANIEPSCSGFVLLLGIDKTYPQLTHHNIFFSKDYEREFTQIFRDKVMPDDPTIYIADTSHTDRSHAPPGGSNLFILVNAPYLSSQYSWNKHAESYGEQVITELEKRGLKELSNHIQYKKIITPKDFYTRYKSNKGSIYGTSSNSKFSAFMRPRNKSRAVEKLYLVGGSVHPGGGIPLVVQSVLNASALIERYES